MLLQTQRELSNLPSSAVMLMLGTAMNPPTLVFPEHLIGLRLRRSLRVVKVGIAVIPCR
jgi:hypothetical protein